MTQLNNDLQANYIIMNLLEKSKMQDNFILENLKGVYAVISEDGEIHKANKDLAQLLQVPIYDIRSHSIKKLFHKENWNIFLSQLNKTDNIPMKSHSFELSMDGIDSQGPKSFHWEVYHYGVYKNSKKNFYFVLGTDLTQLQSIETQLNELFANLPLGILIVNNAGKIEPRYSAYVDWILGCSNLAGQSINEFLFKPCMQNLTHEDRISVELLFSTFGQDQNYFESVKIRLPRRLIYPSPMQEEPMSLEVSYYPVVKNNIVYQILFIIEDKSEIIRIKTEGKKDKDLEIKTAKRIESLKKCSPNILPLAMREMDSVYNRLKFLLDSSMHMPEVVNCLHGLKGSARIARFDNLSEMCHDAEGECLRLGVNHERSQEFLKMIDEEWNALQNLYYALFDKVELQKKSIYQESFKLLKKEVTSLKYLFQVRNPFNFEDCQSRLEKLDFEISSIDWMALDLLKPLLDEVVKETAKKLEKNVIFNFNCENVKVNEVDRSFIYEMILHLINNSLSHGIETIEERVADGKREEGLIDLHLKQDLYIVYGTFKDDGKGFHINKIKQQIIKRNLLKPQDLNIMSTSEVIQYIFHEGFSTADKLDQVSGRGVGLSAIQDLLKKMNGNIKASIDPETRGARFDFYIQLKYDNNRSH